MRGAHNKAMGVVAGVPDFFLFLPGKNLAIELKTKVGRVSEQQQQWLDLLHAQGFETTVAYGVNAAISFVEEHEHGLPKTDR